MKITTNAYRIAATALAVVASPLTAEEEAASPLSSAVSQLESIPGKFSLNTRLRYEEFEIPGTETGGTSIRSRYGYTTPSFNGFTAMVEGETLSRIGDDAHELPGLDDAGDGTDLNQLWVEYKDADLGSAKLGRQIYVLDDQRFVGHVGWRQNIQTFDAFTGAVTAIDNLMLKAFYFDGVERVNANSDQLDSIGLNLTYKFAPSAVLTAFYYDIENEDAAAFDNTTVGARYVGSTDAVGLGFKYALSYASQSDVKAGDKEGDYYAADLSTAVSGITLGAGIEVLEAGFRTPLATVHKFNGFADKFAGGSISGGITDGLEDFYVYAGYKIPVGNGIVTKVIYHDFSPESGSGKGGDEIDLVAAYKLNKYTKAVAKYGDYSADSGATGSFAGDKRMFSLELNFIY
jgi:hypothetical protein